MKKLHSLKEPRKRETMEAGTASTMERPFNNLAQGAKYADSGGRR
jgi:hypothetical protein